MGWALPIITIVLGIIVFTVIIIVRIRSSRALAKMDVRENAPMVEVGSRRKFTHGYSRGIVKKQTPCKNDCTRIEFFPIDVEQGEGKQRPPLQPVVVKNEFIKRLATGEDSSYREIIKCVDRFPTDLPKKMRKTEEGLEMSKEGQLAFLESSFGKWVRSGDEALMEAITTHSRVGMTKMTIANLKEENEALRKMKSITPTDLPEKKE